MQIATNEFGCKDTSYQELYIEPFVIYIPNTFSPDGDEFNNCFNAAFALEVYEWEFQILNRWGETLFVSHDPEIGWDGTYNGKLMQDGIYSYILRYVSCDPTLCFLRKTRCLATVKRSREFAKISSCIF
jgi:gliding motility-associated-like protein